MSSVGGDEGAGIRGRKRGQAIRSRRSGQRKYLNELRQWLLEQRTAADDPGIGYVRWEARGNALRVVCFERNSDGRLAARFWWPGESLPVWIVFDEDSARGLVATFDDQRLKDRGLFRVDQITLGKRKILDTGLEDDLGWVGP